MCTNNIKCAIIIYDGGPWLWAWSGEKDSENGEHADAHYNTTRMETALLVQECQYYHMNEACSPTEKVAITIHCDD